MESCKKDKIDCDNIIIFGAGVVGEFIYNLCTERSISVSSFCDNEKSKHGKMIAGKIPIKSLSDLCREYENMTFIIATSDVEAVIAQIKRKGVYTCLTINEFYSLEDIKDIVPIKRRKLEASWYFHYWYHNPDGVRLKSLDFVITERCSLKCRECSNLMQFYAFPQDFAVENLKREISRLMEVCDAIFELRVIGGEPFMHKHYKDVIEILLSIPNIYYICIYTNGTILPSDEFFSYVQSNNKIWLSISDYGNLSRNLCSLVEKCDEYGIEYEVKPISYWTRCAIFHKHNRSKNELEKIYQNCCARGLMTLIKGNLYPCPYIANGLNLKALPMEDENSVNLMEKKENLELRNKIKKCLYNKSFFSLCDYCNGRPYMNLTNEDKIPPHEQTKTVLTYVKYE